MEQPKTSSQIWKNRRIGITGAKGSLGRSLTKAFRRKGAFVVGLTHSKTPSEEDSVESPQQWITWKCGEEILLKETLQSLDLLVINHGINPQGNQSRDAINKAIEINALSSWRLLAQFEEIALNSEDFSNKKEVWINTSEAEIQPALSPAYEISKRLIGELVSLNWNNLTEEQKAFFKIRKLILGPFRSDLNPVGIMSADFVANQVIKQVELGLSLIIVTPNPLTYLLMPLIEICRRIYSKTLNTKA